MESFGHFLSSLSGKKVVHSIYNQLTFAPQISKVNALCV